MILGAQWVRRQGPGAAQDAATGWFYFPALGNQGQRWCCQLLVEEYVVTGSPPVASRTGSKTHWSGLGSLPFDASVFGAPGCRLLASCDLSYFVATDGAGGASVSIPVPVNPALSGYEVFAQTASTTTGNQLGFVASDAVAIRMR